MELKKLGEHIVKTVDLRDDVLEIIEHTAESFAVGTNEHSSSLVYKGVLLGASQSQKYIMQKLVWHAAKMRNTLTLVDGLILRESDIDSLQELQVVREGLNAGLTEHTKILVQAFVEEVSKRFDIAETLLTDDAVAVSAMRYKQVEVIGFKAYEAERETFCGWLIATGSKKITKMECKCPGCLNELANNVGYTGESVLTDTVSYFPSLSSAFHAYGVFIVEELRGQLTRLLGGIETSHSTEETLSAEDVMKDFMSSLSLRSGKGGEGEQT